MDFERTYQRPLRYFSTRLIVYFNPLIVVLPIDCQGMEVRLCCARVFRGDLHQADHPSDRAAEAVRACRRQRYFAASSVNRVPCIGLVDSRGCPFETVPQHVVKVAQKKLVIVVLKITLYMGDLAMAFCMVCIKYK